MEDAFPVNAGNIPLPPSQSTTILPHQINMGSYQHVPPTTTMHTVTGPGKRRKQKDPVPRSSSNVSPIILFSLLPLTQVLLSFHPAS